MAGLSHSVPLSGVPAADLRIRKPSVRSFLYQSVPNSSGALAVRRSGVSPVPSEFQWEELWRAYLADGYIHRAVVRLRNLVVGNGIRLSGAADVVRYLRERFLICQRVSGMGWDDLTRAMALDFVLYGNSFSVKAYTTQIQAIYGRKMQSNRVVAALYPVSPRYLTPNADSKTGDIVSWSLRVSTRDGRRVVKELPERDVVHLAYNRVDYLYGVPPFVAVLEDVKVLRQMEEDVLRLVHKFAYPILHVASPDTLGYGEGLRTDMQELAYVINTMMEDGVLITMPGQDVRMVGAESIALRVEPYLEAFKRRVFSGLGMSEAMLADRPEPLERQVELERQIRDTVRDLQQQFGSELMQRLIRPLLDEAGYDSVDVQLEFDMPDRQAELRFMTVLANLYALNVLSSKEVRQMMGIDEPLDKKDTYNWNVNMPRLLEPLRLQMQTQAPKAAAPSAAMDDPSPAGRKPGSLTPADGDGDQ